LSLFVSIIFTESQFISGPKKTLFCVLEDELFTPEDELSCADGQK